MKKPAMMLLAAAVAAALSASCSKEEEAPPLPQTAVSSVTPSQGAVGGGTQVTITGSNFEAGSIVRFGSAYASAVVVANEGQITCVTPAGQATGQVEVAVSGPNRREGALAAGFAYIQWWNIDWNHRKAVTVSGSTAGELVDYQVRVDIAYDSDMQADFDDVRFTSVEGGVETEIPFWMESSTASTQARFWVKAPRIPASPGSVDIRYYYGNASAASASDFDSTFTRDFGESGIIGLWHLDDAGGAGAFDSSGLDNHGLLGGFALPYGWTGFDGGGWGDRSDIRFRTGDSLWLDGVDDAVDCGGGSSLAVASLMTVEAWVRGDGSTYGGSDRTIAARWNLQNSGFFQASNWKSFRAGLAPVNAPGGYHGAGFDGRYVYFVPMDNGGYHGDFLRYDTRGSFQVSSSWSRFYPGAAWPSSPPWTTASNAMTAPRREHASAVVNGRIYVFGGRDTADTILNLCEEYNPSNDTWTGRTAMPTPRTEAAAAAVGNLIYVIGGFDGTTAVNTVEIYDTVNNTWSTGTAMPTARETLSAATVNGLIYAIGGDDGAGTYYATVEELNPASGWTARTSLATARGEHGCAVLNGLIYIVSGYAGGANFNSVEVYNPSNDTWGTTAVIPTARRHVGCDVLEGRIIAAGGFAAGDTNVVEEYDPVSNAWRAVYSMPTARRDFSINATGGKIYAAGGTAASPYGVVEIYFPERDWTGHSLNGYMGAAFDGRYMYFFPYWNGLGSHGCMLRYDTQSAFADVNSWSAFDPGMYLDASLGMDLDGFRGGVFDGRYVYAVPNTSGPAAVNGAVLRYDTKGAFRETASWTAFDAGSAGVGTDPDGYQAAVFDGRYIYFSPHHNGTVHTGEVLRYDTKSDFNTAASWETFDLAPGGYQPWPARASMPTARERLTSTVYNNKIYCFGGILNLQTNEEYTPATDSWLGRATMPTGRGDTGCAVVGDAAYVVGGFNGGFLNTLERYNFASNTWTTGLTAMPVPRAGLRCSALNGLVYAMGGYDGAMNWTNTVNIYNPGSNLWSGGVPMNVTRGFFAHTVVDGKIYVFGGIQNGGVATAACEYFNPATGTWTNLPALPGGGRYGCSCAALGRNIYVISGTWQGGGLANIVEIYNTANNTWETSPHAASRTMAIAETVNGRFYVIGGSGPVSNNNAYPEFDPAGYTGGVFDGRYVYFAPYNNQGGVFGQVLRYDTRKSFKDSQSWDTFDPGSFGVGADPDGYYGAMSDGRFVYFVPYYNGLTQHGEVLRFDTRGDFKDSRSWSAVDANALGVGNAPRGFVGGVSDGRYLYFTPYHNGAGYSAEVLRYDTTGPDAAFRLSWSSAGFDGSFGGALGGIKAILNTEDGTFSASSNAIADAGGWHHVAMTYDGAALSVYIDGALSKTMAATGDILPCTSPLTIGGLDGGGACLSGSIDEVRIYDRALPSGEIAAHAQRRLYANPEPVVGAAGTEENR